LGCDPNDPAQYGPVSIILLNAHFPEVTEWTDEDNILLLVDTMMTLEKEARGRGDQNPPKRAGKTSRKNRNFKLLSASEALVDKAGRWRGRKVTAQTLRKRVAEIHDDPELGAKAAIAYRIELENRGRDPASLEKAIAVILKEKRY
jgi:hypothetical protein